MKTIEQLKKEQAAELAEFEARNALVAQLPLIPERALFAIGKHAPWVFYKASGILSALDIFSQFIVVPFTKARTAGTLSLSPVEILKSECECDGTYAAYINVSQRQEQGRAVDDSVTAKLVFFARVSGRICFIKIDLERGYVGSYKELAAVVTRDRSQRIVRANHEAFTFADDRVSWWNDSGASPNYSYLFTSDCDADSLNGNTHAVAQLKLLATALGE